MVQPAGTSSSYSSDERTWATLAHLSPITGFIVPFGQLIAPLLIWLFKRETLPFAAQQAKESLNFQICWTAYAIAVGLLTIIAANVSEAALILGIMITVLLTLGQLVLIVRAAIRAHSGTPTRYPLTVRFVR
jgi:uncharacterized Tic20 family protein